MLLPQGESTSGFNVTVYVYVTDTYGATSSSADDSVTVVPVTYSTSKLSRVSKSLVELEQLKDKARTVQRGNGNLMDDASYKSKVGELEIDLLATEFTELRSLASAAAGGELGEQGQGP